MQARCAPQVTFPSKAEDFKYPASAKHGCENPLYSVASQDIGKEPPQAHQIAPRYFPKNCAYTKTCRERGRPKPSFRPVSRPQRLLEVGTAF